MAELGIVVLIIALGALAVALFYALASLHNLVTPRLLPRMVSRWSEKTEVERAELLDAAQFSFAGFKRPRHDACPECGAAENEWCREGCSLIDPVDYR